MRRWAAILLLCLAAFYVGGTAADHCADHLKDDCAAVCHLSCPDGCATAPVPDLPVPLAAEALPRPSYGADRAENLVSLGVEPAKTPPRA